MSNFLKVQTCTEIFAGKATPRTTKTLGQIDRAITIKRTLGTRRAAGYLRNTGWSLEGALYILCTLGV